MLNGCKKTTTNRILRVPGTIGGHGQDLGKSTRTDCFFTAASTTAQKCAVEQPEKTRGRATGHMHNQCKQEQRHRKCKYTARCTPRRCLPNLDTDACCYTRQAAAPSLETFWLCQVTLRSVFWSPSVVRGCRHASTAAASKAPDRHRAPPLCCNGGSGTTTGSP